MSSRALEAWIIAFTLLMHVVGRRHHTPALELLSRSRVLDDLRRSCIQRTPLKGLSEAIVLVHEMACSGWFHGYPTIRLWKLHLCSRRLHLSINTTST